MLPYATRLYVTDNVYCCQCASRVRVVRSESLTVGKYRTGAYSEFEMRIPPKISVSSPPPHSLLELCHDGSSANRVERLQPRYTHIKHHQRETSFCGEYSVGDEETRIEHRREPVLPRKSPHVYARATRSYHIPRFRTACLLRSPWIPTLFAACF